MNNTATTNYTGTVTKDVCSQHAKQYDQTLGWTHSPVA